jgi:hypothetical protein
MMQTLRVDALVPASWFACTISMPYGTSWPLA